MPNIKTFYSNVNLFYGLKINLENILWNSVEFLPTSHQFLELHWIKIENIVQLLFSHYWLIKNFCSSPIKIQD
jgi:hypothetical protein